MVIWDLCLRKTWAGKSHEYRDAIVYEQLRSQNVFRPKENAQPAFSNSSGLKGVYEKPRYFMTAYVNGRPKRVQIKLLVFKFIRRNCLSLTGSL